MEPVRLKAREPTEETLENWDDDDFMIENDDLSLHDATTSLTSSIHRHGSHASLRSDRDSQAEDWDQQVHLPGDDEKSTMQAIAAVTRAGIPIPLNVPSSALMGGTIKRLGGRKIGKIFQEDWADDLVMPEGGQTLRVKLRDANQFPEVLRQVSGPKVESSAQNPSAKVGHQSTRKHDQTGSSASAINLARFQDDDDDVFMDGAATIKASRLKPNSFIAQQKSTPKTDQDDDFECDFELPSSGTLKLTGKPNSPQTPAASTVDDFDWGEGSIGVRYGGTRRDAFSNRSSSASAMSPSMSSSMTAESENEDEMLDGIVLPMGPLNLSDRLKRRKLSRSPERSERGQPRFQALELVKEIRESPAEDDEDVMGGLEFGEGDLFDSCQRNGHQNVTLSKAQPVSPARPKELSITVTNKPVLCTPPSRLPRPTASHERSHTQPSLEPVYEGSGPTQPGSGRKVSQSRYGHSAQSSVSSNTGPLTPAPNTPLTPRKRLGRKASAGNLQNEPTTTNAQLLRLKRSLPVMRGGPQLAERQSPHRPGNARFDRPPTRTETHRPQTILRPKTPVDHRPRHHQEGSAAQIRKNTAPFLPAGASNHQSQHAAAKGSRVWRRHDSDNGPELRPVSRSVSRSAARSPSPRRQQRIVVKVAAEPWQQLSKPRRLRQFGDGHELDSFDDLPTSVQAESKFTKQPIGSGPRTATRNKSSHHVLPTRSTPSPILPTSVLSPAKPGGTPHFARDTAASRLAREASRGFRASPGPSGPPLALPRVAQLSARTVPRPPQSMVRSKKHHKMAQKKPHLIANLNPGKDSKVVKGMTYNPQTLSWEGNENALNVFDTAPVAATASGHNSLREKETSTPRPVLITNMSVTKGVKRVGDMVFDPQQMCWLKVDTSLPFSKADDPVEGLHSKDDEDPFRGIPDLEDKEMGTTEGGQGRAGELKDEWMVGEEFDVGPEFIRRQREEEERWRKKCEQWVDPVGRDHEAWSWTLRGIVMDSD